MPISNFPGGFRGGVQIQGMPVLNLYGTSVGPNNPSGSGVWYVDSATGVDGNKGDSWYQAFLTVARAWVVAKANDIILIKQGHTETISTATAAAWATAGVTMMGLGTRQGRPTFTLDTAATSTITVSAANISVSNCIFVANFVNITTLFTVTTAKGFTIDSCEVRDTTASLNFVSVVKTSTTDNAADGLTFTNNQVYLLATSGANNLFVPAGTADRVTIADNYYISPTTNAAAVIPLAAGKILTNFLLLRNRFSLVNAAGTGTGYLLTTNSSTNTGFIDGNMDKSAPTTPVPYSTSSGFGFGLNYHHDVADLAGYLVPAADV